MLDEVTILGVKYRIHLHVKKVDKLILEDYDAVIDNFYQRYLYRGFRAR